MINYVSNYKIVDKLFKYKVNCSSVYVQVNYIGFASWFRGSIEDKYLTNVNY